MSNQTFIINGRNGAPALVFDRRELGVFIEFWREATFDAHRVTFDNALHEVLNGDVTSIHDEDDALFFEPDRDGRRVVFRLFSCDSMHAEDVPVKDVESLREWLWSTN